MDAIMMIQPKLIRYALGEPPMPALVDVSSIVPEHILFLDTYFYLVVYHGNTIARWRAEGCVPSHKEPSCRQHQARFLLWSHWAPVAVMHVDRGLAPTQSHPWRKVQ